MSARRVLGYILIASPFVLIVTVGLIVDTLNAAIGFSVAIGIAAVMALGARLLDSP